MTTPILIPILLLATLAHAEPLFVRTVDDRSDRVLQTAVVEYVHPSGVRVSLIATVHLAEPQYYASIRQRLNVADAVVHEGVRRLSTPRLVAAATPPAGLVHQSHAIACTGERFVVGDLDEIAFDRARDARVPIGSPPTDRQPLAESVVRALDDPDTRQATDNAFAIPARNAAAITALRHRLARGDARIVLLYGASHAPDLDRRLIDELGFTRAETTWLAAFTY